ncbi:glycosyltransferase family 4 protein [Lacrimispora sp. 210928-DFI.3.58]|uniref:glycosyltransferase family 4 protein n=1 Tax=Lacrimispora sp. 210928-DFI.3.58 TaxID=2883214 RepID=UPI001D097ACE|nr:glycosyltransferase family 4 protein [Lacrimispora sp. 210928-DFI.3.58]
MRKQWLNKGESMTKKVLIVAQVIPQWYVDTLTNALGKDVYIDIITGSEVKGNVIHSPGHDSRSLKSRLICWAKHYLFMRKWMKNNKSNKYDMIFAISNPPINSYVGLKLKKTFHAPFIYMNWDLYPQVIESALHDPMARFICDIWNGWNSRNYKKIDQVLTIGNVVAKSMNAGLKSPINIKVIPIAADINRLKPISKWNNKFAIAHGLTDKFIVLYSGKMGMGHNIELILDAAKSLENRKNICFVFIGEGSKFEVIEAFIEKNNCQNIKLFPLQSEEMFPHSIACGDVAIVSQEGSMAHLFMPSKTYSMMACGQAIIGIGTEHDDLYELITKYEIGETVITGKKEELAEKILGLYEDNNKLKKYQEKARKVAEEHYAFTVIEKKYKELFQKVIG